jgi:chemotaxis protein MotB
MTRSYFFIAVIVFSLSSCVSTQKFNALNSSFNQLRASEDNCQQNTSEVLSSNKKLTDQEVSLEERLDDLKNQVERAQSRNAQMQTTLNSLSAVSNREAENEKQSAETIRAKEAIIRRIQTAIRDRDSLNAIITTSIKDSLAGLDRSYIHVGVEDGNVQIDLSDKLLFNDNFLLTKEAGTVLEKIATVLDSFPTLEFRVEARSDSTGRRNTCLEDSWDIVSQQAAIIARTFQTRYNILPERITAIGKAPNPLTSASPDAQPDPQTSIVILMPWDGVFTALSNK